MKRIYIAVMFCLLTCATSHASLKITGSGESLQLDASGFPPQMQTAYKLMQAKCVKCHSLYRAVIALQTGIAPITGTQFDKQSVRAYGTKMMRKPDAGMSAQETKNIVNLLAYLIDESAK